MRIHHRISYLRKDTLCNTNRVELNKFRSTRLKTNDRPYDRRMLTGKQPEELTKIYKTEEPLGMWYWIFDDGTMLLSGIFDAKNDEEFIRKFFFMD